MIIIVIIIQIMFTCSTTLKSNDTETLEEE